MLTKFILYVCPTGALAQQLEHYFTQARARFSHNPAHDYMPHISLTGFFADEATAAAHYVALLQALVATFAPTKPTPVLTITNVCLDDQFHGFEIAAPWLQALTAAFAKQATSPTRLEAIRCKNGLHLSCAYRFPAEESAALVQLARETIALDAPVVWVLRFYERHSDQSWTSHGEWQLTGHEVA